MPNQMPQEIEVWYIIPALRREIAKSLIRDYKLSQKKVAVYMGITEAAVSQYRSSKRAKGIVFQKSVLDEIKKSAKKINENNKFLVSEMIRLCNLHDVKQVMCSIHRKHGIDVPKSCEICFEENFKLK